MRRISNYRTVLARSKRARTLDFILLSGDPLSVYTHVMETWIEGEKGFDRSDPKDFLYAVGGYGASHDQGGLLFDDEDDGEGR